MAESESRRDQVRDKMLGVEGKWVFGRVMPRDLLEGISRYLKRVAPDRADDLLAQIRSRAEELSDADDDMAVDRPAKGLLTMASVVLAAFEVLRPTFDGDERRTIRYLQRVVGAVLQRPLEVGVEALVKHDPSLDSIDSVCRKDFAMYGSYFAIEFSRPDSDTFEMRVNRCFFRDFFDRHNARPVTTVLCGWDANWMQALDPATSGLRSERTSLLSLGDDACRFRIMRTDDPLADHGDALDRQFADGN
jgi:L-2-amino-thiazoline-4-carboxylic acid hydrolase-like protein